MKLNSETKLLLGLGIFVLLGAGALFGLNRAQNPPSKTQEAQKPPAFNQQAFDDLLQGARHEKGKPDAPITIVEFGDFECAPCRRAYANVTSKVEKLPNVRFVYRHLPLPMHSTAVPAAIASEAAARQGKFWEMYALLFGKSAPTELDDEYLRKSARRIGLDMARFEQDIKDPAVKAIVDADQALADRYKIVSTPTFIIKDETGAVSFADRSDDLIAFLEQKQLLPPGSAPGGGGSPVANDAPPG